MFSSTWSHLTNCCQKCPEKNKTKPTKAHSLIIAQKQSVPYYLPLLILKYPSLSIKIALGE